MVFVDGAGQERSSHDGRGQVDHDVGVVARGTLLSPLVGRMIVVVRLIGGQDLAEVALAEDELLVEALAAQGTDATFGVSIRARSLDRSPDDPNATGSEDSVEGTGELGVSIADKEPELVSPLTEIIEQVTSELSRPRPGGMSGDQDVDAAGVDF